MGRNLMLWLAVVVVGLTTVGAAAQWDIDLFHSEIVVNEDGSLDVTETIVADFTQDNKRGIFREIPDTYTRKGMSFRVRLEVVSVTNQALVDYPYVTSRENGRLRIRIGDPDIWYSGKAMTYVIRYRVERGLLSFGGEDAGFGGTFSGPAFEEGHDELYWNITGTEWPVRMERVVSVVRLPGSVSRDDVRVETFTGPKGSTNEGPTGTPIEDGTGLRFLMTDGLRPNHGLTVAIGWPKGHVVAADATTRLGWVIMDNLILLAPLLLPVPLYLLWKSRGRDAGEAGSVMVRYEPPGGLTPIEVGTLIDESVDMRDITATIIDLARRGHLRIEDTRDDRTDKLDGKKIHLHRTPNPDDPLAGFEQEILDRVFENKDGEPRDEVSVHGLSNRFYQHLSGIKGKVYKSLAGKGYTRGRLDHSRGAWFALAFLSALVFGGLAALMIMLGLFAPVSTGIAAALCAAQPLCLFWVMPAKTAKGRKAVEGIRGMEEYIGRAELEELDTMAARGRFEALLPHAIALKLSDDLADKFASIYTQPPSWYSYPHGSAFSTAYLVSDLGRGTRAMHGAMTTMPRTQSGGSSFGSGGSGFSGGFSGGGGGGGGGGAW